MNVEEFLALKEGTKLLRINNLLRRWIKSGDIVDVSGRAVGVHDAYHAGLYTLAPAPEAEVKPGDWLSSLSSAERKECAVSAGLFGYFPDALAAVARHSFRSNEKHNPGQPLHWSRAKSSDHNDCVGRHAIAVAANPGALDDGQPEVICRAWRALAALQLWIEAKHARGEKV